MAKQKLTPYKPCDLKPPANLYPDSQPCVRKTFSAPFVTQPAANHTYELSGSSNPWDYNRLELFFYTNLRSIVSCYHVHFDALKLILIICRYFRVHQKQMFTWNGIKSGLSTKRFEKS